jgi:hypothetical protein
MLMWYLSNAVMHGRSHNRGDCAQFLLLAPYKFGDGDNHGGGELGDSWGDGSPYGSGSGRATGNGDGKYNVGYLPPLF